MFTKYGNQDVRAVSQLVEIITCKSHARRGCVDNFCFREFATSVTSAFTCESEHVKHLGKIAWFDGEFPWKDVLTHKDDTFAFRLLERSSLNIQVV